MRLVREKRTTKYKPTERYAVEHIRFIAVLDKHGKELARQPIPQITWTPAVSEVNLQFCIDDPGELA